MKKLLIFLLILFLQSCALVGYKEKKNYVSNTPQSSAKNISINVMASKGQGTIIGHIKNGWGAEMSNIEIPVSTNELIQDALKQEFLKLGFQISENSPNKLLARINQVEMELAQEGGGVGYYSICDLQLFLKTKDDFVERNIVENDKLESLWYVTAEEGVKNLYTAVNKCANASVKEIEKKVTK